MKFEKIALQSSVLVWKQATACTYVLYGLEYNILRKKTSPSMEGPFGALFLEAPAACKFSRLLVLLFKGSRGPELQFVAQTRVME